MKKKSILKITVLFATIIISIQAHAQKEFDKCLLILGAEHRYTQVLNSKSETQKVIDNINTSIDKFDSDKIIYIYSVHKALLLTKKGPKMGLDSIGMIRDERINIVNNNTITKEEINAFEDKKLLDFLQNNNTKEVVVVGFMADYYIQESLLGGKELGYDMYYIPEAIMCKTEKNKEKVFKKLTKKGIKQIPLNEI